MSSVPPPNAIEPPPPSPEPAPDRRRQLDEAPWPLWTAPAGVALGLGLGLVGSVLVAIMAAIGGSSLSHPTPAVTIVGDVVFDLGFVVAAGYLARVQSRPTPADFGFRPVSLRYGIGAVALAGIGYYVVTAIYASLFRLQGKDKLPSELGVDKSTAALVAAAVFVCVIAPVAEEFFFRGFLFGALRRWRIVVAGREVGTWVAAVITGILFGLAHTGSASPQYLVPLGFLGFVLCMLRWRTGSLYPGMALHSLNNSLALGVNQLHWSAPAILGLMAGSLAVIAAATGPLGVRSPKLA
jgi:membrane protease YdiL (CAAX protease family)